MRHLTTTHFLCDSDGGIELFAGDYLFTTQNSPRRRTSPVEIIRLAGDSYACEYDSTGEAYIEFFDSADQAISDPILLVRGQAIKITARGFRVRGVRRSGYMRVTAGIGAETILSNSPSGYVEPLMLRYPAGVDKSTGPVGWTTTALDMYPGSLIAFSPTPCGFAGVLGPSARYLADGGQVPADYVYLHFGFADVNPVDNSLIRFHSYFDRVNGAGLVAATYQVDCQAYWRPAIMWAKYGGATTAPSQWCEIETFISYPFKRVAGKTRYAF